MRREPTPTAPATPDAGSLAFDTPAGRWVLAATVMGSAVAMITATVVNVALPAIGRSLEAGTAELQWVLNGYLLSLASLILIGGALGDRFGHRRIFIIGSLGFALTSVLCALAPTVHWLVGLRIGQGAAAALLMPGSLAIINSVFRRSDRGRAIGAWAALGGIAAAIGPLLGGYLVDVSSWRGVFLLSVPVAAAVVWIAAARVPDVRSRVGGRLDVAGAVAAFGALGALTFALIQGPPLGFGSPPVLTAIVLSVAAFLGFLMLEARVADPMMPLEMFADGQFAAGNLVTFVVYAALGGVFFLFVVFLQNALGYSALAAGAALLPVTGLMLAFSARAGAFAQTRGARLPLTVGPLLTAAGLLLMSRIAPGHGYWTGVMPSMVLFGFGLAATVAPVTAAVLAAAPPGRAGTASGINNAVSRTAQLVAVALFPAVAGLTGEALNEPEALAAGFPIAALAMAAVAALGGGLAWLTISPTPLAATDAMDEEPAAPRPRTCPVDATPLRMDAR
jgi:EmrB/QacA subfamily drug resistance transporter